MIGVVHAADTDVVKTNSKGQVGTFTDCLYWHSVDLCIVGLANELGQLACFRCIINKYGSYLLSRDWAGLKWCHVLKVWEQLRDKHSEEMHNSYR